MSETTAFDVKSFDLAAYEAILANGLSKGLGNRGERVCIEAAICQVLGLEHGDDPKCVAGSVRDFKISLNDKPWSGAKARAEGLHDLGLAQLGSLGVVDDTTFNLKVQEKSIRILVPTLLRELYPDNIAMLEAANECENLGTLVTLSKITELLNHSSMPTHTYVTFAIKELERGSYFTVYSFSYATMAIRNFSKPPNMSDKYLILAANTALEVLKELKSPGVELLSK